MNRNEKFINAWKIVQKIAILDVPKIQVQINKPDTRAGVAELVLESGHVREVQGGILSGSAADRNF